MNKNIKYIGISLSFAAALALSGCGSSSSGGDNHPTDGGDGNDSTVVSKVATIDGKAVDGYLKYSTVCLDMNSDGFCQPTEPFTLTDENGAFTLSVSEEQQNDENYAKAQLVVYGGQDSDRPGEDFIGKLKAPNDGTGAVNVTPITTLVSAYIEKAGVSDISVEEITAAKTKVATVLGIDVDKIDADPRADGGDAELVNATLQLQYAVNAMVTATGDTDTDDAAEDIFAAFAAGLDDVTETGSIESAIADIIEKAPEDKLDAKAVKAKEVAKTSAANIQAVMNANEDAFSNSESLQKALTEAVVTQAKLIEKVEEVDFEDETVTFTGVDFNSSIDFEEEAIKVYLGDLGVEIGDDFNASAFDGKVSFDMDLEALQTSLASDTTILEKIDEKITAIEDVKQNLNDQVAAADGAAKMETLKTDVDALLTPTKVATVTDAKNMFTQLREAGTSFIDMDTDGEENNTSTIVGSQAQLITDKIQPAVEAIADDFEASATAMDTSMQAFDDSLETNFGAVLGTETTDGAISTRLQGLETAQDNYRINNSIDDMEKVNWSVTSGNDTLSHTYSKTGDTVTETMTFNGSTVTIVGTDGEDGELTSVTTSGTIALTGEGYDLKVTSLSFGTNGDASFKASGTITGTDSSTMTLTALDITFNFDKEMGDTPKALTAIEAKFDGTIVSSGRTIDGELIISEASKTHTLKGSYTDTSADLSFEGTVTVKADLNDLKTVAEDNDKTAWIGSWEPLVMVNFEDGEKSLMTSYTKDNNVYTLTTQSDQNVTCNEVYTSLNDVNGNNIGQSKQFTCNGATVSTFISYDDKILTATLSDGTSETIENVWYNYNNGTNIYELYLNYNSDTDTAKTVTNITVTKPRDMDQFDAEATFDGLITHGTKKVSATFGMKNIGNSLDVSMFAQDVEITDGESSITMNELRVTTRKDDGDDKEENYANTQFVSYSYYENEDKDDENDVGSISVDNLAISIVDTDNKALTFDADFFASYTPSGDMEVKFNGTYTYADTTFTGIIDAKGNDQAETTSFDISGDISANGFEPFTIAAAGSVSSDAVDAYALFTRGADYKLGLHLNSTTTDGIEYTDIMSLADSNGVVGSYNNKWYEDGRADTNDVYYFTDKDGEPLATYGEDSNDNEWEIKYTGGDAESLF